jgi:hypothetical protein
MRFLVSCTLALMAAEAAFAETPERDKAWDLLIAEAKKHGGEETQYKTSTSYVFQRPDGLYVTFTRMLDSPTRAVCVISKDQNATVCGNWDTGKLKYGSRADAASAWTYSDSAPEAASAEEENPFASLLASLANVIEMDMDASNTFGRFRFTTRRFRFTASEFHWIKGH